MASPKYKLSAIDWRKIGLGLLIALAGAALAWVEQQLIPQLENAGSEVLLLLAAISAVLVNFARKWLSDTRARSHREARVVMDDLVHRHRTKR